MRDVFIGVCYKVEVVGVWGCVSCNWLVCVCVSFGCVVFCYVVLGACFCCCSLSKVLILRVV